MMGKIFQGSRKLVERRGFKSVRIPVQNRWGLLPGTEAALYVRKHKCTLTRTHMGCCMVVVGVRAVAKLHTGGRQAFTTHSIHSKSAHIYMQGDIKGGLKGGG